MLAILSLRTLTMLKCDLLNGTPYQPTKFQICEIFKEL